MSKAKFYEGLKKIGLGSLGAGMGYGVYGALAPKDPKASRSKLMAKRIGRGLAMGAGGATMMLPFKSTSGKMIAKAIGGGSLAAGLAYPGY